MQKQVPTISMRWRYGELMIYLLYFLCSREEENNKSTFSFGFELVNWLLEQLF